MLLPMPNFSLTGIIGLVSLLGLIFSNLFVFDLNACDWLIDKEGGGIPGLLWFLSEPKIFSPIESSSCKNLDGYPLSWASM
jgi:hypothetical protein